MLMVSGFRAESLRAKPVNLRQLITAAILYWVFIAVVFIGVYMSYESAYTDFARLFLNGVIFSAVMALGITLFLAVFRLARNRKTMAKN